jgi:hypothetical protein
VRQAIEARFLALTDRLGSRLVARCLARSMTVGWDHAIGVEGNHRAAAQALIEKLGWTGQGWAGLWCQGGDATGSGYVFVFSPEPNNFAARAQRLAREGLESSRRLSAGDFAA